MSQQWIRKKFPIMAMILLSLLLIGCESNNSTLADSSQQGEVAPTTDAQESGSPTSAAADLSVSDLPDPTATENVERPELGFALGNPNLRATDPNTVSLASGQIQLIEFFAFW